MNAPPSTLRAHARGRASTGSPLPPPLRLVAQPPERAQQVWYALVDQDLRLFLEQRGHRLSDPALAHGVFEQCAEQAFRQREGLAAWSALSVAELWRTFANLHHFFPQPRLVVALDETLRELLPWLCDHGRLERTRAVAMLHQLEALGTPLLERARAQLAARQLPRARVR
ncbi:MAG: hypothetical protein JWN48_4996 [Myxococcaceae bacterium]|nr:hypothetical protein [Myxococcaceae bacterium]